MQQAGYHHENSLAMQIRSDTQDHMKTRDSQMLAMLNSISSLASESISNSETSEVNHNVNHTADQTQLDVLKLLKELSQEMKTCQPAPQQQRRFLRKTPDDKNSLTRIEIGKHLWTHGSGNHSSVERGRRAQGHK